MKPNQGLRKVAATLVAGFFFLGVTSLASLAASQFEGTWKVKDNEGNPMEITLSADGSAKGDRSGKAMNGTWKEESDAAVISWTTGWTTKIVKEGSQYKKTAYKNGQSGAESEAQKVK
jgi:hypothetical protein